MKDVSKEVIMKHDEFVKKVMEYMLNCDDDIFKVLKKQYTNSKVTRHVFTGCGFCTGFYVPDELSYNNMHGVVDDVCADIKGTNKIDLFKLCIEDGKIKYLDGVASYGDWEYNYNEKIIRNAVYNAITRRYDIKFSLGT